MKSSLASRLSALYAALLGITIVVVILASSIALVYELSGFTRDILSSKREQAATLAEIYAAQGTSLQSAAPDLVRRISGVGLQVAVYDQKGNFLAGDKSLQPLGLTAIKQGKLRLQVHSPTTRLSGVTSSESDVPTIVFSSPPPPPKNAPRSFGEVFYNRVGKGGQSIIAVHAFGRPPEPQLAAPDRGLFPVFGGWIAMQPSFFVILQSLIPYWRVVAVIAVIAILLSWFIGRIFARQSLRPLNDVTASLQALAAGDYTLRKFIMGSGDEIETLTSAYNDAVAGVSTAMAERKTVEDRMRQFVADAGHELRTPLTVIGGYIDVLRRGAVEEPKIARQILGTMSFEREHMRNLIDRLMRLARLDSEEPARRDEIDVAQLLKGQCEAARRLDEHRAIDYSVDGGRMVVGDRAELGEAIWNVVENALKYAPDAPIHLSASGADGATVITVRDEGPGMTEPERLHAFERFYRGDERGEIVGSGLGLAIAKRAVERSGGEIGLESAPGRGTTVKIRLRSSYVSGSS